MQLIENLKELPSGEFRAQVSYNDKTIIQIFDDPQEAMNWLASCSYRIEKYHEDYLKLLELFQANLRTRGFDAISKEEIIKYVLLTFEPNLDFNTLNVRLSDRVANFFNQ